MARQRFFHIGPDPSECPDSEVRTTPRHSLIRTSELKDTRNSMISSVPLNRNSQSHSPPGMCEFRVRDTNLNAQRIRFAGNEQGIRARGVTICLIVLGGRRCEPAELAPGRLPRVPIAPAPMM